jgi:hypothetical protein
MLAEIGLDPPTMSDFSYRLSPPAFNLIPMLTEMPPGLDWETCDRASGADRPWPVFPGVHPRLRRPVCPCVRGRIKENVRFLRRRCG